MAVSATNDTGFEKISLREKFAYGGGDFASNLLNVLVATYATFFYTDALGLNPAIIGSIMMFSRIADGATDIVMGYIMDRTRSKHGKARPWILWIAVPLSVSTILLFMVPNLGDIGKYIYIAITYNLVTSVFYTMISQAYGTLNSLMTRDQHQRMTINAFRMSFSQFSSLIASSVTLPLVNALGGSTYQKNWIIVSVFYGILAAILFLVCFGNTKERVTVAARQKESIGFKKSVALLFRNKYWILILLIYTFVVFRLSIDMTACTYYAKYILGDENIAGIMTGMAFLPALVLIPLLAPVSNRFGKRNVALTGSLVALAGQFIMYLNPTSPTLLIVCALIRGIGNASISATIFAMVGDAIEYGQWKNGTRLEGMIYSSASFGAKAGAGVAGAIVLSIMGNAGYDGTLAVQATHTLDTIRALYLFVPAIFLVAIPILYAFYQLDKQYPRIMSDLAQREANM